MEVLCGKNKGVDLKAGRASVICTPKAQLNYLAAAAIGDHSQVQKPSQVGMYVMSAI